MAKTKAKGSTKLGRDSISKRLGIKLFGGQKAKAGSIIVRQRGTKFIPGKNVRRGKDDTLYSITEGIVKFTTRKRKRFDSKKRIVKVVNVIPSK